MLRGIERGRLEYCSSETCAHFPLCGLRHLPLRNMTTHMLYAYGIDLVRVTTPTNQTVSKRWRTAPCAGRRPLVRLPIPAHETHCWTVARRPSTDTYNRQCACANGLTILAEGLRTIIQRTAGINSSMLFCWGKANYSFMSERAVPKQPAKWSSLCTRS